MNTRFGGNDRSETVMSDSAKPSPAVDVRVVIPCTIGILTYNSAATLERTLKGIEGFAERIICDGGSSDGTLDLARRYGCQVLMQDARFKRSDGSLRDFAGAMRQLVDAASMPWFFKVDSDEVPSPELVNELRHSLSPECRADGLRVPLKYVVGGRVIADATTYPMHQLRIIRVGSGLTYAGQVHEHIDSDGYIVEMLQHSQLLPQPSIRTLIPRWRRYQKIELDAARQVPRSERWPAHARRHLKVAKYLAWRYTKVLRSGVKPRLPLRYELLRIVDHLVAAVVLMAARHTP